MKKYRAGIIGATGMVGQRFAVLLDSHPFFEVTAIAASPRSAGKTYTEALDGRWKLDVPMPEYIKDMIVRDASDVDSMKELVDMVFCAIDLPKAEVRALEEKYAKAEIPVVSNNSACRGLEDVPMLIPEINPEHTAVIETQKKRLGTKRGFIAVKPNCSIQSYVPLITPLLRYEPYEMVVTTYQAISGAGKTFAQWPEMIDNVIPYIGGEEEKSEKEPMKIWGKVENGVVVNAALPVITTQCIRVPVSNGHLAAIFVKFRKNPTKEQILEAWDKFEGEPQRLKLPHAPEKFITYFEENDRPQTKSEREIWGGMGITAGRLRKDTVYDWKFVGLSHNTLRGAAGGAVLSAEYLAVKGFFD
ncbi:MAG: aspartate-semialdehyde dehydrogenase [Clostridia bacterium]|nr:aspartate-semialdehyde dehydrogenase [Clostridia bacterium]